MGASFDLGFQRLQVGFVLLVMYRSASALGILVAPALGVAGGVVAALALGQPLSFFSMMGAFVVVGTGADYSILRYEAARGGRSPLAGLPILITALTAIPLGVAAGVYLEEYARRNWMTEIIEINVTNLAGVVA